MLVSDQAPFDEAEARRPRLRGAKTNMTIPFPSIRQLFGRVLGSNTAGEDKSAPEFSTLGIGTGEAQLSTNVAEDQ